MIKNLIIAMGDNRGITVDIKFSKQLSFEVYDLLEKKLSES
jgi:hypothetical protein